MRKLALLLVSTGIATCASSQPVDSQGWRTVEPSPGARAASSSEPVSGWRAASVASLEVSLGHMAVQLAASRQGISGRTIAISDFSASGGHDCGFADYLGETLTTRLYGVGQFRIVERRMLAQVLKEKNLQAGTFLVDPASRRMVGRLLGADAIVAGSFADLGESITVVARMIDVQSGEILAVAQESLVREARIDRLLCGTDALSSTGERRQRGVGAGRGVRWLNDASASPYCDSPQPWVGFVNNEAPFSSLPRNTYVNMGFNYGSNIWVEIELNGQPLPLCGQKQTMDINGHTVDLAPPQSRVFVVIEDPAARMSLVRHCWAFNPVTGRFTRYGSGDYDTVGSGYDGTAWHCSWGR